jgi:hypothetical protein
MAHPIEPLLLNHVNMVVEDYAGSVGHLRTLFGADLLMELPQPEWHAGLVDIGRVIFELFAPTSFLLNARYGPHYLGVEYQADMDIVRSAVAGNDIRIVRDIGVALHTHPADCFGVAFEFYDGSFHANHWPLLGRKMRPASYWRDEHELGLLGLRHYTIAVGDLVAGARFIDRFIGGHRLYEDDRPLIGGRAIGYRVADSVLELQASSGQGTLQDHLKRWGNGIRSTVFGVVDLERARQYFIDRGVVPLNGSTVDSFSLPMEASFGMLIEFTV